MPYIQRDADGRIASLQARVGEGAAEYLPADHPEILAFLADDTANDVGSRSGGILSIAGDLRMVRVLEDLIEVLIEKRVITFTDLPEAAREKLMMRRHWRERLIGDDNPINFEDDVL